MTRKYSLLLLIFVLFFTACSKKTVEEPDEIEETEEVEVEKPEELTPKNIYPLTGIGTNEEVNNRIVSVMVNNFVAARPQTGLSKADLVFEILAEGNITRFLALFQSELPDVVGPVRSAREYYFELARAYDALYIYHGADQFINDMIYEREIEYIDGFFHDNDGKLFKRESFRKAPHNSYLQFEAVYPEAEARGYDIISSTEPLPFLQEDEAVTGDSATHVEIAYSKLASDLVEYAYDKEEEKYIRFSGGEKTVELETEEPIKIENIFIVEADHKIIDDVGRRSINLEAGGNALLVQKGKIQQLQWENQNGKIIPVKDGQTVGFVPGKTWINIVPSTPGIEQSIKVTN